MSERSTQDVRLGATALPNERAARQGVVEIDRWRLPSDPKSRIEADFRKALGPRKQAPVSNKLLCFNNLYEFVGVLPGLTIWPVWPQNKIEVVVP